jgi:hypothetical protein
MVVLLGAVGFDGKREQVIHAGFLDLRVER